jgi:hypothetical protein
MAKKVILILGILFISLTLIGIISASYQHFEYVDYHNQNHYYTTFDYSRGYPNYEPGYYLHNYDHDYNDYYWYYGYGENDCYCTNAISHCYDYHCSKEVPYTNDGFKTNLDNNCKLYGSHLFCQK